MNAIREFVSQLNVRFVVPCEYLLDKNNIHNTKRRVMIATTRQVLVQLIDNVMGKAKTMDHVRYMVEDFIEALAKFEKKAEEPHKKETFNKIGRLFVNEVVAIMNGSGKEIRKYNRNRNRDKFLELVCFMRNEICYQYSIRFQKLNAKYPGRDRKEHGTVFRNLDQTRAHFSNTTRACSMSCSYTYSVDFLVDEFVKYSQADEYFSGADEIQLLTYAKNIGKVLDFLEKEHDEHVPIILKSLREKMKEWKRN